jgi:site-specific recombinase XerD
MTPLAPLVTAFFRQNLAVEKGVSKNTIASYSYTFKFLCRYVSSRLGKSPSELSLEDLDAPMVRDFLEHLERDRGNTARTRSTFLAGRCSDSPKAAATSPEARRFCRPSVRGDDRAIKEAR